jgi:predicted HAD superfamily Cof-like phosphohydrolase
MDTPSNIEMVAEFHGRFGFPVCVPFRPEGMSFEENLNVLEKVSNIANILAKWSAAVESEAVRLQKLGDERLYRCHLMTEELAEAMTALAKSDAVLLADGLGDLKYVVDGTGVTFGIPLDEVFAEIHRSNMTKQPRKPGAERMRDKGPKYSPPDIAKVIGVAGVARIQLAAERAKSQSKLEVVADVEVKEITDAAPTQ